MKLRLLTLAATAGVIATMIPGHAAAPAAVTPKAQITDQANDANGVNNQGFDPGTGANTSIAGPADDANADITSVLFKSKFKVVTTTKTVTTIVKKKKVTKKVTVKTNVPDGFTVTLTLSAAPDGNHAYDVEGTNAICDGTVDFTYSTGALGLNEVDCLSSSDPTAIDTLAGEATVVGNSIVWNIPAGAFANNSVFTDLYAQTEVNPTFEPVMDQAYGGTATYKVGQ